GPVVRGQAGAGLVGQLEEEAVLGIVGRAVDAPDRADGHDRTGLEAGARELGGRLEPQPAAERGPGRAGRRGGRRPEAVAARRASARATAAWWTAGGVR